MQWDGQGVLSDDQIDIELVDKIVEPGFQQCAHVVYGLGDGLSSPFVAIHLGVDPLHLLMFKMCLRHQGCLLRMAVYLTAIHASGERRERFEAAYRATGRTNILGQTREFTVLHRSGQRIQIELSVSRVELADRERPLFIGSFRDITARKLAEQRLEDSEHRLRAIFEGTFQYIGLLTPQGTVLEANQTALQATGATREEVVGRPFWETRWWSVSEEARRQVREAVERSAGVWGSPVTIDTPNRTYARHFQFDAAIDQNDHVYLIYLRDPE